jgi:hypothetical protein
MSRIARTTFRRLTRQEEIRTTANVRTIPMQKARTTFRGFAAKTILKSPLPPANPPPRKRTMIQPTPTPATLPTALARSEYRVPSNTKVRTRLVRCIPTARAMPSSCLRSAASMTKIRKIRSIPAATENWPKRTKSVKKISPLWSA